MPILQVRQKMEIYTFPLLTEQADSTSNLKPGAIFAKNRNPRSASNSEGKDLEGNAPTYQIGHLAEILDTDQEKDAKRRRSNPPTIPSHQQEPYRRRLK